MRLTGNFEKNSKKFGNFFFSIFSFLRDFVVSSCRKSSFRVFLSLRYGADLGRSRLVHFVLSFLLSFSCVEFACVEFSVPSKKLFQLSPLIKPQSMQLNCVHFFAKQHTWIIRWYFRNDSILLVSAFCRKCGRLLRGYCFTSEHRRLVHFSTELIQLLGWALPKQVSTKD